MASKFARKNLNFNFCKWFTTLVIVIKSKTIRFQAQKLNIKPKPSVVIDFIIISFYNNLIDSLTKLLTS